MIHSWPDNFPVQHVRVARPTDNFQKVVEFYSKGIGLETLFTFGPHEGYTGVVFGLPDLQYQLEFTHHSNGSPCPAPSKDNLLVFYITDQHVIDQKIATMKNLGYYPVEPENPYWLNLGVTFEDPDGWRVVFMNRSYFS